MHKGNCLCHFYYYLIEEWVSIFQIVVEVDGRDTTSNQMKKQKQMVDGTVCIQFRGWSIGFNLLRKYTSQI